MARWSVATYCERNAISSSSRMKALRVLVCMVSVLTDATPRHQCEAVGHRGPGLGQCVIEELPRCVSSNSGHPLYEHGPPRSAAAKGLASAFNVFRLPSWVSNEKNCSAHTLACLPTQPHNVLTPATRTGEYFLGGPRADHRIGVPQSRCEIRLCDTGGPGGR